MNLPQFVPSDYCLRCRGCCVFTSAPVDWRARLTVEEEIALEKRSPGCSFGGILRALPVSESRLACVFLDSADHHCRVYSQRPLECAAYPFLLSVEDEEIRLYAHLACPFVREHQQDACFTEHALALTRHLQDESSPTEMKAAANSFPDYSRFADELLLCGKIPLTGTPRHWLAQKEYLRGWFKRRDPRLSASSFVNLFAWSGVFDLKTEEAEDNLLVLARQGACEFLLCPPLGVSISPKAVDRAFSLMKGGAARVEAVASVDLAYFDDNRYRANLQGEEYYYETRKIVDLTGSAFASKRGDINYCEKVFKPVFRSYVPQDAAACHEIFDRWLDRRRSSYEDEVYRAMLVENRSVHRRMIRHAGEIGLTGRVVEVAGKVAGYTFGYPLNEQAFCVALEITDPSVKGLAAYIFRSFCADNEVKGFRYINAMDDFGMPAVAKAKRSWRPVFLEKVYSVCLKP